MILERILWIALIVVVSMFAGWILGNLYAISKMKSRRKKNIAMEDAMIYEAVEREKRRKGSFEIATQGDPRKV